MQANFRLKPQNSLQLPHLHEILFLCKWEELTVKRVIDTCQSNFLEISADHYQVIISHSQFKAHQGHVFF